MRNGFPSYLDINDTFNIFKPYLEYSENSSINQKVVCSEIIRSCGLKWKDFKLGNTKIFFRKEKLNIVMEKIQTGDLQQIINRYKKLRMLRGKWRVLIAITRLCSIWKQKIDDNIENTVIAETVQSSSILLEKSKKRKLDSKSITGTSSSSTHSTQILQRTTITIPSNDSNVEDQLRVLLRQEREKNIQLNNDYRKLQKRNLDLMENLNSIKTDKEKLVLENQKLQKAIERSCEHILTDHNYF